MKDQSQASPTPAAAADLPNSERCRLLDELILSWQKLGNSPEQAERRIQARLAVEAAWPVAAAAAGVPTGALKVAVDLLREVVGPLEVSAAVIEDEDGGEAMETLLSNIKRYVDQFDRLAVSPVAPAGCLYPCCNCANGECVRTKVSVHLAGEPIEPQTKAEACSFAREHIGPQAPLSSSRASDRSELPRRPQ